MRNCICGCKKEEHMKGNGYNSKGKPLISICVCNKCFKFVESVYPEQEGVKDAK